MLVMVGEFRSLRSETVTRKDGSPVIRKDGTEWVRHVARLLVGADGDFTESVEVLGKELLDDAAWPEPGTKVALEVSLETRVAEGGQRVFRTYKAWRRAAEVEAAFAPAGV